MEIEKFDRETIDFEDFKRFELQSRTFDKQFCGVYRARLATLKDKLFKKASVKWRNGKILQIVDLTKEENAKCHCAILGTLYKHQELKPSILKEISEELQAVPQPPRLNYCSSKDALFLEDDVARVKLVGNVLTDTLVTGLICSVTGHCLEDGSFWVDDICFPGPYLTPLGQSPSSCAKDHGKFLLLLSGLDFCNQADSLALELLSEWITGMLGNEPEQKNASKIVRVIIAGNSVRGSAETFSRKGYFENKNKDSKFASKVQIAVHRFDRYISKIAQSCSIILLPGEYDPSCHSIPQHPLHPNILPITSKGGNLYCVTNPWIGKIGSRLVAGSSGQPITDITKVSNTDLSPLQWLEKTLDWYHFAPTSPDTLAGYPFDQVDPLVMQECPNIYFAGNMEVFETKLIQGTYRKNDFEGHPIRLICIPKFSLTHSAILVNLESLDTKLISFGTA